MGRGEISHYLGLDAEFLLRMKYLRNSLSEIPQLGGEFAHKFYGEICENFKLKMEQNLNFK